MSLIVMYHFYKIILYSVGVYSVQWLYGSVQGKHSVSLTVSSVPHPGMWTSKHFLATPNLVYYFTVNYYKYSHGLLDIKGEWYL